MRVACKTVMEGPGPNEAVVVICTRGSREEEVIVDKSAIVVGTIEVGFIAGYDSSCLVELPRESVSGKWRIWVDHTELRSFKMNDADFSEPKPTLELFSAASPG
jgi:hypothetical protein